MRYLDNFSARTKDQPAHTDNFSEGWSFTYSNDRLTKITYPNGSTAEIGYADNEVNRVKLPDNTVWTKPDKHSGSWYEGNTKDNEKLGDVHVYSDGKITVKSWKTAQERTWYCDGTGKTSVPDLAGDELQSLYKSAMPKIDSNRDRRLSKAEIRNAIRNPEIKGKIARFAAIAHRSFDDLSSLRWKYPENEVTIESGDIDAYAAYGRTKQDNWSQLAENLNFTGAKVGSIYRNLLSIDERNRHRNLYSLSGSAQESIRSKFVNQGSLADCSFHAAVAAVAEARPDIIEKMIQGNKDGTYSITFADAPKHPLRINALTESEKMVYGSPTEGGLWPLIVEKAYGEQLRKEYRDLGYGFFVRNMLPYQLTDIPGQTERVLDKITGQKHETIIVPATSDNLLSARLKSANEQHIPMTCGIRIVDIRPHVQDLELFHAYSVLSYDHNKRLVTLRNPHGNDESQYQGTFTMTLKQFKDNFTDLYLAWQPKN